MVRQEFGGGGGERHELSIKKTGEALARLGWSRESSHKRWETPYASIAVGQVSDVQRGSVGVAAWCSPGIIAVAASFE